MKFIRNQIRVVEISEMQIKGNLIQREAMNPRELSRDMNEFHEKILFGGLSYLGKCTLA